MIREFSSSYSIFNDASLNNVDDTGALKQCHLLMLVGLIKQYFV